MNRLRTPAYAGGLLCFVWFTSLSIGKWNRGRATGYDLGIFSQAAEQWSRGHLPSSFLRSSHTLLADHFSPLTVVFGVVWRIWPDPRVLLVLQAACLAVTVGLMAGMATARLGVRAGWAVVGLGVLARYLLAAALFDVHEVALAAPLVAVLVCAVMTRRFWWALAASLLLILVKEDLGLTVGMAGIVWALRDRRSWRRGLVLSLVGAMGLVLAIGVVAHFNPSGNSSYLSYFGGTSTELTGSSATPVHSLDLLHRIQPLLYFTGITLIIGWRSSISLLALPTLAWRMASSNPHYWSTEFHYDLVLWPIAIGAAIEAWPQVRPSLRRPLVAIGVIFSLVVGGLFLIWRSTTPLNAFHQSRAVTEVETLMRDVPAGARVAAQNDIAPYLIPRYRVTLFGVNRPEIVDYSIFTAPGRFEFQATPCARNVYLANARTRNTGWVIRRAGNTVLIGYPHPQASDLQPCPGDAAAAR